MRQRRYAKRTRVVDDGLPNTTKPLQQLSTDVIIVSKSGHDDIKTAASGDTVVHTIRDAYSGMPLAAALSSRVMSECYDNFKFFAGIANSRNPDILVKSDAAKELTGAVDELGWHREPSLENRWPHNTIHERWHGTYKSVPQCCRAGSQPRRGTLL